MLPTLIKIKFIGVYNKNQPSQRNKRRKTEPLLCTMTGECWRGS